MAVVHLLSNFEPKKYGCVFLTAVSTGTLKILSVGYNLATETTDDFVSTYEIRIYEEWFIFLSLRKQGCKSASYAIYTLFYTKKLVI